MRASIDQLVEKLERQVTRYRTRGRDRRRRAARANAAAEARSPRRSSTSRSSRPSSSRSTPMTPEEAVLQLELVGPRLLRLPQRRLGRGEHRLPPPRRRLRADRAPVIFRREPMHKKLAREARLEQEPERGPVDPGPALGRRPASTASRARAAGTRSASAEGPGLAGDEVHFVALPNGDLVVDEDEPPDTLAPLADAVEQTLEPPYRAEAVRQSEDVWAVAARRVAVASFGADGERARAGRRRRGPHA